MKLKHAQFMFVDNEGVRWWATWHINDVNVPGRFWEVRIRKRGNKAVIDRHAVRKDKINESKASRSLRLIRKTQKSLDL